MMLPDDGSQEKNVLTRREWMLGATAVLGGCVTRSEPPAPMAGPIIDPYHAAMYGAIYDEPFPVPAVDLTQIDPRFLRQEIAFRTSERAGTVVVNTSEYHAYLVLPGGRAIRYGVGVGKDEGFNFQGTATVGRKAAWPGWTPTANMIRREPDRYAKFAGGLPGGPENPLGARALYLYRDGRDTLYRLHGTIEPWTIGSMVSSGCVRFLNHDIIDLYRRVPVGARVVVQAGRSVVS